MSALLLRLLSETSLFQGFLGNALWLLLSAILKLLIIVILFFDFIPQVPTAMWQSTGLCAVAEFSLYK